MEHLKIETVTDHQLVYLLEQRVAEELFKPIDDKNYQLVRYMIDLIEVITDSMEDDDDD